MRTAAFSRALTNTREPSFGSVCILVPDRQYLRDHRVNNPFEKAGIYGRHLCAEHSVLRRFLQCRVVVSLQVGYAFHDISEVDARLLREDVVPLDRGYIDVCLQIHFVYDDRGGVTHAHRLKPIAPCVFKIYDSASHGDLRHFELLEGRPCEIQKFLRVFAFIKIDDLRAFPASKAEWRQMLPVFNPS